MSELLLYQAVPSRSITTHWMLEEIGVPDVLRGREFIVGDHFSAADVMVGASIMWGTQLMSVMPKHPELLAYWARLEQRPAWQRSFGEDQKIILAKAAASGS